MRHARGSGHAGGAGIEAVRALDGSGPGRRGHARRCRIRSSLVCVSNGAFFDTVMKLTSFDEFKELASRGTFVPVCKEIIADLLTPVSAFLKIADHSDCAFLLESVEGGEHVGRYSFLGKDPFLVVRARDGKTTIERTGHIEEAAEGFMP